MSLENFNKMRRFFLLGWLITTPIFAQTAPVIKVASNMVSVSVGTSMYCAMIQLPTIDDYHVYCYKSIKAPWDKVVDNHVFNVSSTSDLDGDSYKVQSGGSPAINQTSWMVYRAIDGKVYWQVTINSIFTQGFVDSTGFVKQ